MNTFVVEFRKPICWRLHRDDPKTCALQSPAGWVFVNPLAYLTSFKNVGSHLQTIYVNAVIGDTVIVQASRLIFITPSMDSGHRVSYVGRMIWPEEVTRAPIKKYFEYISRLLRNLRYVSKQFDLPKISDITYISFDETQDESMALSFPKTKANAKVFFPSYRVDTAATWQDFEAACSQLLEFIPPVYDSILLDAVAALFDGDYRQAILYSAMSVECLAAIKLDEVYKSAIAKDTADPTLRIASFKQARGKTIQKDPIYAYLSYEKKDFTRLLHEIPLYLLKRSLLLEDERLYQVAKKLYLTRNKIVHLGEAPDEGDAYFSLNRSGAVGALECAIEVFDWFGETRKYANPTMSLFEAQAPEDWSIFPS